MRPLWLLAALSAVVAGSIPPSAATAAGLCEQRETLVAALVERYREVPIALGVTSGGSLVEVLKSTSSESWTIIVTSPQGLSCLVFSGDGWREQKPTTTEPDA